MTATALTLAFRGVAALLAAIFAGCCFAVTCRMSTLFWLFSVSHDMSSYILTRVKCNIGERNNAHAPPAIINHRYAADELLFHDPAAFFKRYVRRYRDGRFAHAVGRSQVQRIKAVGYSAAHNIAISDHSNRNF